MANADKIPPFDLFNRLLTDHWMRAQSLSDPAAAKSDRPDHGPMGAFCAWPAETMATMCEFGEYDKALDFLHRCAAVTKEGPFSQSRELLGTTHDAPVRIASRGDQTFNAADVWMMRRAAQIQESEGNAARAERLRADAEKLLPAVLALYEPGQGVWDSLRSDGTRVQMRHVFDFASIGLTIRKDISAKMRDEMINFVERELLADC